MSGFEGDGGIDPTGTQSTPYKWHQDKLRRGGANLQPTYKRFRQYSELSDYEAYGIMGLDKLQGKESAYRESKQGQLQMKKDQSLLDLPENRPDNPAALEVIEARKKVEQKYLDRAKLENNETEPVIQKEYKQDMTLGQTPFNSFIGDTSSPSSRSEGEVPTLKEKLNYARNKNLLSNNHQHYNPEHTISVIDSLYQGQVDPEIKQIVDGVIKKNNVVYIGPMNNTRSDEFLQAMRLVHHMNNKTFTDEELYKKVAWIDTNQLHPLESKQIRRYLYDTRMAVYLPHYTVCGTSFSTQKSFIEMLKKDDGRKFLQSLEDCTMWKEEVRVKKAEIKEKQKKAEYQSQEAVQAELRPEHMRAEQIPFWKQKGFGLFKTNIAKDDALKTEMAKKMANDDKNGPK